MNRRSLLALLMFLSLGVAAVVPATAGAAPADKQASQAVTKIEYPGFGIEIARLSGDQRKLKGASASFKKFIVARLDVLFADAGSKPRCAASPTITVERYHSAGYARGGEGWFGKCPGGGYAVIYEKSDSGWEEILGTQEARYCEDLAFYGVPDFIGGPQCFTENEKAVRYHLRDTEAVSPDASGRRVEAIVSGHPIVSAQDVLLTAAEEQVAVVVARKGYLDVDGCVSATDGGPVAAQLGGAPYGCAATVTYKKNKKESMVLRMDDDFMVTELFELA